MPVDKKPVALVKLPKPVSDMDDAELDAFADAVVDVLYKEKETSDGQARPD
jgi:hypothetical protein